MKYKYVGSEPQIFPTLGKQLSPGEEFDSDLTIINPYIDRISEVSVAPPIQPVQPVQQEVETPTEQRSE